MSGSSASDCNVYDEALEVSPNDLHAFFKGLDEYPDHFNGSDMLPKFIFLKATTFFKEMSNAEIPGDIPPELQLISQAVLVIKSLKTLMSGRTPNNFLKLVILGYHEHLRYGGTKHKGWHVKVLGWQRERFQIAYDRLDPSHPHRRDWDSVVQIFSKIFGRNIPTNPFERGADSLKPEKVYWLVHMLKMFGTPMGETLLRIARANDFADLIKKMEAFLSLYSDDFSSFFQSLIENSGDASADDEDSSYAASSAAYADAIKKAATSLDPMAVKAASSADDAEHHEICMHDPVYLEERGKLADFESSGILDEKWFCYERRDFRHAVNMHHAPTSTFWYFIYKDGWYVAKIQFPKVTTVVGSQSKEEFVGMINRFLAPLPPYRSS
jgi:hypothetical protein